MSDSLIIDWLNENEQRAYPLVINNSLNSQIILDASLVYEAAGSITAVISSITVVGNIVTIAVPGITSFSFNKQTVTYPHYAYSGCSLIVVGQSITTLVSTGTINVPFDPSVIYDLRGKWRGVSKLKVSANQVDIELIGDIVWTEGYQFAVSSKDEHNINLAAGNQYGLTVPCGTNLFGYPNDCSDIISFINGVTTMTDPGKFNLTSDNGIKILEDPENNRIFIGLNFDVTDVCKKILPIKE